MIGSDSTFRDAWLTGAARAFFVSAYADACDSFKDGGCNQCPDGPDYCDECEILASLPCAIGGQDWMDVAPATPIAAYALAGELWARLASANIGGVYTLATAANLADGGPPDPDDFGHCLAMQALGTGVSWFDNHKNFPLVVPHMEANFSLEAYQQ